MLKFRVLAIDVDSKTPFAKDEHILYVMMAHKSLWQSPELNIRQRKLTEGQTSLVVAQVNLDPSTYPSGGKGYILEFQGEFAEIEPRRLILLDYLDSQGFELKYVLKDEVSERISCDLYPLLYRVENALRGYIIQFMVTQLGAKWWEITATNEQSTKVKNRSKNEQDFSRFFDNKAYLIDFGDLGKIIYQQSAGFKNTDDLVKQVLDVDETPEAIKSLKGRLQTNYQRFFKETFKDKSFQAKWESLEKLRNKVAHNNLFTSSDWDEGKKLANELIEIIAAADKSSESLEIPPDEKASLRESFTPVGYIWDVVQRDEFLNELKLQEQYFHPNGYVGLTHFVRSVLGAKGFDYANSYDLAEQLAKEGIIDKYEVPGERDGTPVPAIRIRPNSA